MHAGPLTRIERSMLNQAMLCDGIASAFEKFSSALSLLSE
jgi:hypothetical protein